jgi:two-component system, NtrC family, sensor kinase
MGLRTKIFLPLFLASIILTSYITTVWIPRWRSGVEAIYQESEKRHLESVAEGLVPLLLGNQLDGIYGTLDALLDKNKNWVDIEVFDPVGRVLYPLDIKPLPKDHSSHVIRILSQDISYLSTKLGKITVKVDLTRQLSGISTWCSNLLTMLMTVTLFFLLSTLLILEHLVRKPLRALSDASKRLADGNYNEPLPSPKKDEVGILISSFAAMRDAIGSHAERLSSANKELEQLNETLEQRVHERTTQLNDKNAEVQKAYDDLKTAEGQLLQQDKLASIGQLAAGVAHEINNPMGFITSNLGTLEEYAETMNQFFLFTQGMMEKTSSEEELCLLQKEIERQDIRSILEDIGPLITESKEGAERVRRIVLDLKNFAREEESGFELTDVNECIRVTVNMVRNQLQQRADLHLQLNPLQQTSCCRQQINQVFVNLLVNAGQAIENHGTITVTSRQKDTQIILTISDTGRGMTEEIRKRIFDPFFTTQKVGAGTGLGLSISYGIIKKHDGEITVESEPGKGSTFTIRLPIHST